MKFLASIFVAVAWCIPGKAHQWAVRLRAERRAGIEAMKRGDAAPQGSAKENK